MRTGLGIIGDPVFRQPGPEGFQIAVVFGPVVIGDQLQQPALSLIEKWSDGSCIGKERRPGGSLEKDRHVEVVNSKADSTTVYNLRYGRKTDGDQVVGIDPSIPADVLVFDIAPPVFPEFLDGCIADLLVIDEESLCDISQWLTQLQSYP